MSEQSDHESAEDRDGDEWYELGIDLAAQQGREHDAERAYRNAIANGNTAAMFKLGLLLEGQPGREGEAELAYRAPARPGA
jgi:hypothetical protein